MYLQMLLLIALIHIRTLTLGKHEWHLVAALGPYLTWKQWCLLFA